MELYVCSTYYHVLISVLKCIDKKNKADIAITDYIPEYECLVKRINKSSIFQNTIVLKKWIPQNRFDYYFYGYLNTYITEKRYGNLFKEYDDIFVYMDDICFAKYLKDRHIYYNLIEDGFNSFKIRTDNAFYYMVSRQLKFRDKIRNLLFRHNAHTYKYFLNCPYIKTIEINDIKGTIFDENEKKIIIFPRHELFKRINDNNVDVILDIFLDDRRILDDDNIALILTCCFFDDGYLNDENDQILLYKRLCKYYMKKGYKPIIKPHPRDTINYSASNMKMINKFFPAELLSYFNAGKIEKYVSIYSNSVYNFPPSKVDYFDSIDSFYEKYNKEV